MPATAAPPSEHLTDEQLDHAREIWARYQLTHDLTDKQGHIVAIDPTSGRIWMGDDIIKIPERMLAEEGQITLCLYERVGDSALWSKGEQR